MQLFIIRHGQSTNNALEDQRTRSHDPALTEIGKKQADCVAEFLAGKPTRDPLANVATGYSRPDDAASFGITHIYCSPMYRALQTAMPIAHALGLTPEVWIEIHEHGGIYLEEETGVIGYPGRSRQEILDEFPHYVLPEMITESGWWKPENKQESLPLAYGRAMAVAVQLRERAERAAKEGLDERIALVTHGTFIDGLLKALFNQLPGRSMYFLHYNTAITRIDFRERGMLVRYINRVDHLTPELIT